MAIEFFTLPSSLFVLHSSLFTLHYQLYRTMVRTKYLGMDICLFNHIA